jgi:hypothetical protein
VQFCPNKNPKSVVLCVKCEKVQARKSETLSMLDIRLLGKGLRSIKKYQIPENHLFEEKVGVGY